MKNKLISILCLSMSVLIMSFYGIKISALLAFLFFLCSFLKKPEFLHKKAYFISIAILIISSILTAFRLPDTIKRLQCQSQMKSIGLALAQYAADNQEFYPNPNGIAGLKLLFDNNYLSDLKILRSPVDKTPPSLDTGYVSYIYIGKDTQYSISNSNTPILLDKCENHKNAGHVLYANGQVKFIEGGEWEKIANPKGTK